MQRARLVPVSGISNDIEAEQRATSAFLAVLSVVRDLSNELFSPLGASRARIFARDTSFVGCNLRDEERQLPGHL